jgi:hypothetical protein
MITDMITKYGVYCVKETLGRTLNFKLSISLAQNIKVLGRFHTRLDKEPFS